MLTGGPELVGAMEGTRRHWLPSETVRKARARGARRHSTATATALATSPKLLESWYTRAARRLINTSSGARAIYDMQQNQL
jgi:hypothetical protein